MPPGIRATVEFSDPDTCPITALSAAAETTVDTVSATVCPDGESVTEFTMDADYDPEGDVTPVFSHGSTCRYRLSHDGDADCPCECLGRYGCPVDSYVAREGTLTLVFHAADYDELERAVGDLRDRFPDVDVTRLVRSDPGERGRDSVAVDRGKLTARQREVLETAYEMGYFERPRRANATEIAAELDVNPATFREHLTAAETKILGDLL